MTTKCDVESLEKETSVTSGYLGFSKFYNAGTFFKFGVQNPAGYPVSGLTGYPVLGF
jgi:hypothetical protein